MKPIMFLAGLKSQHFNDLFNMLVKNDIDLLLDIRMDPKKPDIKVALRNLNFENGREIGYRWLKEFGNPFEDKDDLGKSLDGYRGYLMGMSIDIADLYDLISKHRCCMVDDCRNSGSSYRRILAETMKRSYDLDYMELGIPKIETA